MTQNTTLANLIGPSMGNYSLEEEGLLPGNESHVDTNTSDYYNESLMHFISLYRQIHGEFSLSVCVFGIIANVLNIIVLSRKNMISPTNAILTGIALSDLIVIGLYIPHVIHSYMRQSLPVQERLTYGWALYTLCYSYFSVVFHSVSIWLTVLLAVWRYVTVRSPTGTKNTYSMRRALMGIASTFAFVPIICIPIYLCFTIHPLTSNDTRRMVLYKVDMVEHQVLLQQINFWAFSVLLKLIPCISLTYLTIVLLKILFEARKRKERLIGKFNHRGAGSHGAAERRLLTAPRPSSPEMAPEVAVVGSQPKANQLYLEIADNSSPTDFDQSSKSSRGEESLQAPANKFGFLGKCCLSLGGCLLDRCSCCCGFSRVCCHRDRTGKGLNGGKHSFAFPPASGNPGQSNSAGNSERTTKMLNAVLIMFLVCEFPSGILALLSGILGKDFFSNVYNNFGEIMDMLALINSAVNFVLYCFMSAQFRKTFSQLFCIRWTERISQSGSTLNANGNRPHFGRPEPTFATELLCTYNETETRKKSGDSACSSVPSLTKSNKHSPMNATGDSCGLVESLEMTQPNEVINDQTINCNKTNKDKAESDL